MSFEDSSKKDNTQLKSSVLDVQQKLETKDQKLKNIKVIEEVSSEEEEEISIKHSKDKENTKEHNEDKLSEHNEDKCSEHNEDKLSEHNEDKKTIKEYFSE